MKRLKPETQPLFLLFKKCMCMSSYIFVRKGVSHKVNQRLGDQLKLVVAEPNRVNMLRTTAPAHANPFLALSSIPPCEQTVC